MRKGFAKCKCSNCEPDEAGQLLEVIQQMNIDNFDTILDDPHGFTKDPNIVTLARKRKKAMGKGSCRLPQDVASNLVAHLLHCFEDF
ncbi:hypothetical protein PGT21_012336 [Puccinia graminis f. sp. tritici]|uniref:ATP-dependent DNA helicase sgs1 n=1 Tax=Puccinia graminis f. sp. tritici TaxID=56615 RepID=A0A5B0PRS4_PUCGR|nr:hypothetical protein PGT21_012336 [Puccinia graminis f. sp. tritici]